MNSFNHITKRGEGTEYTVSLKNGNICVEHDTGSGTKCKEVKCIDNRTYTIKINKRSISGQGGAPGVFAFLKENSYNKKGDDPLFWLWTDNAVEKIMQM